MIHIRPFLTAGVAALVTAGALFACSALDGSSNFAAGDSDSGASGGTSSGGFGDGGTTPPARGVILVHAAAFGSMRVCFENYPSIPPQPDRKVLPQANVVGVDLGGMVRLGPMLQAPGQVYVIPQRKVTAVPGDPNEKTCGDFLATSREVDDYLIAGRIDHSVGVEDAEVLALTGCGNAIDLFSLKMAQSDCPGFDEAATAKGNLSTRVFRLSESTTTTDKRMPMAFVNMARHVNEQTPAGSELDITFGELDAGATGRLAATIPSNAGLYAENPGVVLDVDQTVEATFGLRGFRIAYRDQDGGATVLADQSLAAIQTSSRSNANPTTYFAADSNFAFFLLGDPRMKPTFDDGGANPGYDFRRAVHLLAIPVRDESESAPLGDAGADASIGDAGADAQ